MKRKKMQKSPLIFTTCILSGISVIISLISLTTEHWLTAQVEYIGEPNYPFSQLHYGLFSGTFTLSQGNYNFIKYQVKMTCMVNANKCAMLCGYDELRNYQLKSLINGQTIEFDANCPHISGWTRMQPISLDPNLISPNSNRQYINATIYIITVSTLIISIIFGVISCLLSIWNTIYQTIEIYLGIYILYITNGLAGFLSLISLTLWGFEFGATLSRNVAILLTIEGLFDSNGLARLGYSYWLLLPTSLLYLTNLGILIIEENSSRKLNY